VPAWVVLTGCLIFYGLIAAALVACQRRGLPIDEIKGLESDLAHWNV
jgi:hypothetical protein